MHQFSQIYSWNERQRPGPVRAVAQKKQCQSRTATLNTMTK